VIGFLLKELERAPNPVFSKRELLAISPHDFEDLKRRKILTYYRPPGDDMETLRWPRCQHGCLLTVQKFGELYEAFCLNHPGEDAILVGEDELNRYALSVSGLLEGFRSANHMDGKVSQIDRTSCHLGFKTFGSFRVDFVFTTGMAPGKLVNLSGLKHVCTDAHIVCVLTPTSQIEDVLLEGRLRRDKVVSIALLPNMDPHTFVVPFERLLSGFLEFGPGQTSPYPELSPKQADDYKTFEYRCFDRVHIPGSIPMKRSNLIVVNGTEVAIPDYTFPLLLSLVFELKRGSGGWIDRYSMAEKGILDDPDRLQIFSNLRNALKGGLQGWDAKEFIQSDRSKNHRISTHPDFVSYNKDKLLNHPTRQIRELAERLP